MKIQNYLRLQEPDLFYYLYTIKSRLRFVIPIQIKIYFPTVKSGTDQKRSFGSG